MMTWWSCRSSHVNLASTCCSVNRQVISQCCNDIMRSWTWWRHGDTTACASTGLSFWGTSLLCLWCVLLCANRLLLPLLLLPLRRRLKEHFNPPLSVFKLSFFLWSMYRLNACALMGGMFLLSSLTSPSHHHDKHPVTGALNPKWGKVSQRL